MNGNGRSRGCQGRGTPVVMEMPVSGRDTPGPGPMARCGTAPPAGLGTGPVTRRGTAPPAGLGPGPVIRRGGAPPAGDGPEPVIRRGGAPPAGDGPGPVIRRGTAPPAGLGGAGLALLAVALLSLPGPAAQCAEPKRVAVLDVELLKADYLPDPHRITPEERRRLDMVADLIRDRLRAEGYDPVSAARTKAAIQAADPGQYLHACNGCERDIARDLGADWVAVGWIQLVSYLIVNLNVLVIDVESGAPVGHAFVDLRGNTERSWRRATIYMLDNILVDRLARRR